MTSTALCNTKIGFVHTLGTLHMLGHVMQTFTGLAKHILKWRGHSGKTVDGSNKGCRSSDKNLEIWSFWDGKKLHLK